MIYITGDLHGGAEYGRPRLGEELWPEGYGLTRDDYVIVGGDFGYVWDGPPADDFWLDWYENRPWTTLFIDGNHENFDLLESYPVRGFMGGRVHEVRPHVLHLIRGEVFEIDSKRLFAMGGAASHDIEDREPGVTWWAREMPDDADFANARANLDACDWAVDYVVTHDCPALLADDLAWECNRPYDPDDPLEGFLQEVCDELDFETWLFGHYHDDEWRDEAHRMRLIYRDIVPASDPSPKA